MTIQSIYEKFIKNAADIKIDPDTISVSLKKNKELAHIIGKNQLVSISEIFAAWK
jgi:hypothetical protein